MFTILNILIFFGELSPMVIFFLLDELTPSEYLYIFIQIGIGEKRKKN